MVEAESRRDGRTQEQKREDAEARRAKLVRQLLSLGLFVVLVLGAWLWERAAPPDLSVSQPPQAGGPDPFAYAVRDVASARGGDFWFDVAAPERTREDAVDYRFHVRKAADSAVILLPTKVTVTPPADSGAGPRACRLGEPGERAGRGEEEVSISDTATSFQWGCAFEFPGPPNYVDPSELPDNTSWPMRFEVEYRSVRLLPLGFWPVGGGLVALDATTTVVYRD